jgi:hypothetical protein
MFKNFTKYEIYEDGRIWSYKTNRFLKPSIEKKGYQRVNLYDNEGTIKGYLVHRIVYEAVTGNPIPEGLQVNHIDEDKTNNHINNLNLMTPKENCNWGTGIERCSKARTNGKLSKAVGAFKDGELVMSFLSTQEAQRNGFKSGAVSACCRNCFHREGNNIYKGYEWRYI